MKKPVIQLEKLLFADITADHKNKLVKLILKYKVSMILLLVTLLVILCRFISMWHMPDVFCDEQDILNHMQSILTTGYDTQGNYMPLFPKVGAGLATFTYLYPMMAFLSILGVSAIKARFIQQILTITACFFTALGVKIWADNNKMFWITLLTGLTLPWGFVQANRIWDPSFVPVYFGLYFFFFVLLMKNSKKHLVRTYIYAIVSFSLLVLLATVYPPARIPAVAMWIYSLIWAIKNKQICKKHIIAIFIFSTLVALPLALNLLKPEFNSRTASLLIFNQNTTLYQQLYLFIKSFVELFNPDFLFISGDKIYRHSLPIFGMLGTISIIPFITLLRMKKHSSLAIYMFFVIVMTYFSTALTYDYQPHGLRSSLAWLPYVILLSYGWLNFLENKQKKMLWYVVIAIQFVLYFIAFITIHHGTITLYP